MVRSADDQVSTAPIGVFDQSMERISAPISPPPARQSRVPASSVDMLLPPPGPLLIGSTHGRGRYTLSDGEREVRTPTSSGRAMKPRPSIGEEPPVAWSSAPRQPPGDGAGGVRRSRRVGEPSRDGSSAIRRLPGCDEDLIMKARTSRRGSPVAPGRVSLGVEPSGRFTAYPPGGMMSEFDHGPLDDVLHHFAIFFRFHPDKAHSRHLCHRPYRARADPPTSPGAGAPG